MRKINNKTNSINARRGSRGKRVLVIAGILLASIFIFFAWYGVWIFFTTYEVRSPVVIRTPIIKRNINDKASITLKKPPQTKKGIIPKVEAKEYKLEEFPKYLTDQAVGTRKRVMAYLSKYYSGNELIAFDNLIKKESGYRYDAVNPDSGACGMPQSLPCLKMGCTLDEGGEMCQAEWMRVYIENRYGSPMEAYKFHLENNWY